ncbi:MAG: FkbM family methyltransferase [Bacteroidia bacterium]
MEALKNKTINSFVRLLYNLWYSLVVAIEKVFFKKIRVSGVVDLKIDEVNFKMYAHGDDGLVDALYFKNRNYNETLDIRLFKELSKQSNVILDIGANTGLYSVISKLSNNESKVFSFEPYHANCLRLRKNIDLNGLTGNIEIVEKAIGDSNSPLIFAVPEDDRICDVCSANTEFTNQFYRKWIKYKNVEVPQITLDEFVFNQKIDVVDLIKIDVETYELNVFKGSLMLIEKKSPIILVEIFINKDKVLFYENVLKPLGYYCYIIINEGILRVDSLVRIPDYKNFILSKKESSEKYLSFSKMPELIHQIKAK